MDAELLAYIVGLFGLDTADFMSTKLIMKNPYSYEANPVVEKIGLLPATIIAYLVDAGLLAYLRYVPPLMNQGFSPAGDFVEWVTRLGIWGLLGWKAFTVGSNLWEVLDVMGIVSKGKGSKS